MTNEQAARIIRELLVQRRARTTQPEVEALDLACTVLSEADYQPRTGIEAYGTAKCARVLIHGRRPQVEDS
jgi:hypothetical protein